MAEISQATINKLTARRDAIIDELNSLTASAAGGKPNTNQPGAADHVGYKKALYEELKDIQTLLADYDQETGLEEFGASIISQGIV